MVSGHSAGNTHICFQVVDGPFHDSPDLIGAVPFIGITLQTWEHAELHIFIGVSGPALFCSAARDGHIRRTIVLSCTAFWGIPI